jgi:hypothetical protein
MMKINLTALLASALITTAAFAGDPEFITPGGDGNPAMDALGTLVAPGLQGGSPEERGQRNHERQVDKQLERLGDTDRLRYEQNYRRLHNNP